MLQHFSGANSSCDWSPTVLIWPQLRSWKNKVSSSIALIQMNLTCTIFGMDFDVIILQHSLKIYVNSRMWTALVRVHLPKSHVTVIPQDKKFERKRRSCKRTDYDLHNLRIGRALCEIDQILKWNPCCTVNVRPLGCRYRSSVDYTNRWRGL